MKMKTLYVHIGTPRAGASAIRQLLAASGSYLADSGYALLDSPEKLPDIPRDCENAVCSDERIWTYDSHRSAEFWTGLLEDAGREDVQVKAVVYLRRQDEYIYSLWDELLRESPEPLTLSWEEFRRSIPGELRPDYDQTLGDLASLIGRENLIVRRFERIHFFGGTIESDFLHAIGLRTTEGLEPPKNHGDAELAGNTHEIKRILNTLPQIEPAENDFFRTLLLGYSDVAARAYPARVLSPEETAEFLEPYLEGNRRVAREYFGEDSPLFDMSIPNTAKWTKDNPCLPEDVIRLTGSANRRMLQLLDRQRRELADAREYTGELERRLGRLERKNGILHIKLRRPRRVIKAARDTFRVFIDAMRSELT